MNSTEFKEGRVVYRAAAGLAAAELAGLATGSWQGGYIAFANSEKRLDQLAGINITTEFLSERITGVNGAEGYVTELNLWRSSGGQLEELAAEREDDTFCLQHWQLETAPAAAEVNCWHRAAETRAGSHHKEGKRLYSGTLKSVEVVWPEKRLNFFITEGE